MLRHCLLPRSPIARAQAEEVCGAYGPAQSKDRTDRADMGLLPPAALFHSRKRTFPLNGVLQLGGAAALTYPELR